MADELEQRLGALYARLPGAGEEAERHALAGALAALPEPVAAVRRPFRPLLAAAAALAAACAVAAGALAAAGALHVTLGHPAPARRTQAFAPPRLLLPGGASGIAAVVDGRLWLTTRGGLRIEGLPVSAAALSPHALYVAAGIGDTLVAMAPDGARAWSHAAGGRVVAAAWAPDGLRIAYVVRRGGAFELRAIEGNGRHDRLLDRGVRPVAPSWRADSLAVAYVGAGGRPVVYDLAHRAHRAIEAPAARPARAVAFAPRGAALAVETADGVWERGAGPRPFGVGFAPAARGGGIAWIGDALALAVDYPAGERDGGNRTGVQIFAPAAGAHGELMPQGLAPVRGPVRALAAHGGSLVLALGGAGVPVRLAEGTVPRPDRGRPVARERTLLRLPRGGRIDSLSLR